MLLVSLKTFKYQRVIAELIFSWMRIPILPSRWNGYLFIHLYMNASV
jgi:hypothetical protein